MDLLLMVGPAIAGASLLWFATKCKGKNARDATRLAGWGFLLLYLRYFGFLLLPFGLGYLLLLAPTAICFFLAFNSIVKEMRAQKNGEFTEAA